MMAAGRGWGDFLKFYKFIQIQSNTNILVCVFFVKLNLLFFSLTKDMKAFEGVIFYLFFIIFFLQLFKYSLDGWMACDLTSFSTVFPS